MPYNSVAGLPPLPTQSTHGSVYEPKQTVSFVLQSPHLGKLKDICASVRKDSKASDDSSAQHSLPETPPAGLPAITTASLATSDSPTLSLAQGSSENGSSGGYHHNALLVQPPSKEVNPWAVGATLAELKNRRLHSANGVAVFRPVRYATLAMAEYQQQQQQQMDNLANASPSSAAAPLPNSKAAVKPLLVPFISAQELARQASEETWHTRQLRYMQWLRRGALAAKANEEAKEDTDVDVSLIPGDFLSYVSRPALGNGGGESGVTSRGRASSHHLPPLSPSGTWLGNHDVTDACVSYRSGLRFSGVDRIEQGGEDAPQPAACAPNPNEMAVRRLFRIAQGAALTLLNGAATVQKRNDGDAKGASEREDDALGGEQRCFSNASTAVLPSMETANASQVVQVALVNDDGRSYLDEDGFSSSRACRAGSESDDEDEEDDAASTASMSEFERPPEYAVACLLRKHMHDTVAAFTASAAHTLDMPPQKKTRRVLGQARLQDDEDGHDSGGRASAAATAKASRFSESGRPFSTRAVRRLIYEETYERGLLLQLAFQSSPTRWYSTELPNGQDGIVFRKAYAPVMRPDGKLRARLNSATAHAMKSIAQPRQEAVQAAAGRHRVLMESLSANSGTADRHPLRLTSASSTPSQGTHSGDNNNEGSDRRLFDASFMTLEEVAREKAVLFGQWTRLHRNLSAQWQLFQDEQAERLRLLGHFVSCAYPEPCICLQCDQEVLNMSAIPLEPTVKPLCWYTSVVLSEHHDVLQKEMLRRYEEGLTAMYAEFRVLFISTYTREKLLEEEARRFEKMTRYHEFCLRVAAQNAAAEASSTSAASDGGTREAGKLTGKEAEQDVQLPAGAEPRMWRLRQRRLQSYKAFDSPFFSYLIYTEMITVSSAEEQVRRTLEEEEATRRRELVAYMRMDEQFSAFFALERRRRSWIIAEMMESHSAMLTGPVVQLHAAHMAELHEEAAAAYAKECAKAQQVFVHAAYEEKHVAAEVYYGKFKIVVREARQQVLTLFVANRSATSSVEVSRRWLLEQRQSVVVRAEQRLRDQLVLHDEPAAFQGVVDAAAASICQVRQRESRRKATEKVAAEAAALAAAKTSAEERERPEAGKQACLRRESVLAHPQLQPCAKLPRDTANSFAKLAMTLDEDFAPFMFAFD